MNWMCHLHAAQGTGTCSSEPLNDRHEYALLRRRVLEMGEHLLVPLLFFCCQYHGLQGFTQAQHLTLLNRAPSLTAHLKIPCDSYH